MGSKFYTVNQKLHYESLTNESFANEDTCQKVYLRRKRRGRRRRRRRRKLKLWAKEIVSDFKTAFKILREILFYSVLE